jgi:hypothetical protein
MFWKFDHLDLEIARPVKYFWVTSGLMYHNAHRKSKFVDFGEIT